jgi:hypothetical protein
MGFVFFNTRSGSVIFGGRFFTLGYDLFLDVKRAGGAGEEHGALRGVPARG